MKKLLSVFLIAMFLVSSFAVLSAAEEAHTHEFGEWQSHDEVTLHHYRECPCGGEGAVEIEPCVWDEGEPYEDYGILYRCTVCGSTTMENAVILIRLALVPYARLDLQIGRAHV